MKPETITVLNEQSGSPDSASKGKVIKKAGKRIGYNYIIIKSYKESQKNDVVKCLYIKSLTDWGFCVIKEGSYGDTKDKQGRDIIDRLKWQKQLHEQLQDIVPIPRLMGYFEERGNYYLVMEHISGKPLQKICAEKRKEWRAGVLSGNKMGRKMLGYLIQIAGILSRLHAHQVVHRDTTPNNYMVMSNGKVSLIDMEMCYSISDQYPTPAFALGTYGYMSKQQEAISIPTTAEDIFALGAIILQVWSGVTPGKLTTDPIETLSRKISFFIPDRMIAELVTQCLLPEDHRRATADEALHVLKQYRDDLARNKPRTINDYIPFTNTEILHSVEEAIITLSTPLFSEEEKGWFADDMKPPPDEDKHKLRKQWYASYNRGAAGIMYVLAQAKNAGLDVSSAMPHVENGLRLIKEKYINHIERKAAGLHFGADGIAATLAVAIHQGLIPWQKEYLDWMNLLLGKKTNSIGIMKGVAGQGLANLLCLRLLGSSDLEQRLEEFVQIISDRQEADGSWSHGYTRRKYTKRKKKRIVHGFAHGMAGTICFLLEMGKYFPGNSNAKVAAERGLQWLMRKAVHRKKAVYWRTSKKKDLNYSWADGTAGIALTFIRAYESTGREIYKQYAAGILRGIPSQMTDSNISQVQGLSGLGEVYLETYRVFKEEEWLNRAAWLVQVIMQLKKVHPKFGTYWLVENERHPVANIMIGNAGIIHFLLRYCFPEKIGFPLMPGKTT